MNDWIFPLFIVVGVFGEAAAKDFERTHLEREFRVVKWVGIFLFVMQVMGVL